MATIEKRTSDGRTSYRAKIRLKGHSPESATFERVTDARKWAQATEAAIREGRYFQTAEAKKHTLKELIDRYVVEVLPKKPRSAKDQTQQLSWWSDAIGHLMLSDVTQSRIVECRDKLSREPFQRRGMKQAKPRSPATVNRYLAALSHVMTIAVKEWGWMPENPMAKVTRQKEAKGRVRFLSDLERISLVEAIKPSRGLHTAFMIALTTGARRTEIWAMRWPQVDFQRARITLTDTKNKETRVLTLAGPAMTALTEWAKVRRLDTDLVFPQWSSKADGWIPRDFTGQFRAALGVTGIENFRWHDIRHTTASYLAMNGATLAEIAEVLGHKTLAMVKRYAHMTEGHTANVVTRMVDNVFGGGGR